MQEIRIYMQYEKTETHPEYAFLEALGFDKNKDKFAKIIDALRKSPCSTLDLSKKTGISRNAINYYLEVMSERGLVEHYNKKYYLISSRFTQIIQYMEIQTQKTIDKLKELAKEIDNKK